MDTIKELDTVALLIDLPDRNLLRGDVGTVVIDHSDSVAEVEFVDEMGRTSSLAKIEKKDLMRLRLQAVPV